MSVPLKGLVGDYDDAYNFYISQLRITIERAFGVLVHRWSILWRPTTCPLAKVSPLVMCLCRLHNFCIDVNERDAMRSTEEDASFSVRYMDALHNRVDNCISSDSNLISLERGRPTALLHGGSHFFDAPRNRLPENNECPMDKMIQQVKNQNLERPKPKSN